MDDVKVLTLENKGFSMLGLVNAEMARLSGRRIREAKPGKPTHAPGQRNWHHHVIMVYAGHVFDFDFDFTNEPTVLSVNEYCERMFLDAPEDSFMAGMRAGRQCKLDDYLPGPWLLRTGLRVEQFCKSSRSLP